MAGLSNLISAKTLPEFAVHATSAKWMNDELRLLEESATGFFESELVPHIERWEKQGQIDREFWNKAGAMGLLGASVPEEYGGSGGTFAHDAVIYNTLGHTGDLGFGFGVHNIAMHYVLAYGTEEQKQRWLPRLCSGELVGAIAMSEPSTGSDLQNVKTRADKHGNGYKVNGSKTFISNGQIANFFMLVAKTDTSQGSKGISLFGVETDGLGGFKRGRKLDKLGLKSQDTSELFFEDMPLSGDDLIGLEPRQGFYQLMQQLPWERLIIALQAVSICEFAIKMTLDYVRERKAFNQRIMDFQNTRFKLAEVQTKLEVTRAFVDKCLEEQVAGTLSAVKASMAKYWASDIQCEVVDECLQLHGGYGFMMEFPIAKLYADSRVQKIYGGTNEIMKELIARDLDLNG